MLISKEKSYWNFNSFIWRKKNLYVSIDIEIPSVSNKGGVKLLGIGCAWY